MNATNNNIERIIYKYTNKIHKYPISATHLIIENIENIDFPNSIKYLTLANDFNQKINNLPNSIIYLTLGGKFNQQINNLPDTIEEITIYGDKQMNLINNKYFEKINIR